MHCCVLRALPTRTSDAEGGREKRLELELNGFPLGGYARDTQIRVGSVRCSKGRGDNRYFTPECGMAWKVDSYLTILSGKL
jgi:hypothetical protein